MNLKHIQIFIYFQIRVLKSLFTPIVTNYTVSLASCFVLHDSLSIQGQLLLLHFGSRETERTIEFP